MTSFKKMSLKKIETRPDKADMGYQIIGICRNLRLDYFSVFALLDHVAGQFCSNQPIRIPFILRVFEISKILNAPYMPLDKLDGQAYSKNSKAIDVQSSPHLCCRLDISQKNSTTSVFEAKKSHQKFSLFLYSLIRNESA